MMCGVQQLWCAVCSSYAILRLERRTAIETITADMLQTITADMLQTITADMLQTVWNELDYRVDVCRITNGAHIEHL